MKFSTDDVKRSRVLVGWSVISGTDRDRILNLLHNKTFTVDPKNCKLKKRLYMRLDRTNLLTFLFLKNKGRLSLLPSRVLSE